MQALMCVSYKFWVTALVKPVPCFVV